MGEEAVKLDDFDSEDIYHVSPTFGRKHVTNQRDQCWCQPKVEFHENVALIVHEVEQ